MKIKEDKKMKKGKIGIALVTTALAIVAYKSWRSWKKRSEKFEEITTLSEKELEQEGVPVNKVREEIDPEEDKNNLVKGLYLATRFNPEFDLDLFNTDDCLKKANIIHVTQFDNENLSIVFEIPEFTQHSPKIGDYITEFSSTAKNLWANIVKFSPRPKTSLLGYFIISYKEDGSNEERFGYLKIPEYLYKKYSDEKHDGLTEYISRLRAGQENKSAALEDVNLNGSGLSELKAIDVQLFFQIEFPIQSKNEFGINLKAGVQVLKYLTENLVVKRRDGRGKGVEYRNIFFHAPNPDGEFDFMYYYDTDENNQVFVTDFEF